MVIRKVEIKTVFPDGTVPDKKTVQTAPSGKAFSDAGIERMLGTISKRLQVACPHWEFRLVKLSPVGTTARYVFSYSGIREMAPSVQTQITPS